MVNRIQLGRRTSANKIDVLQKDAGVWNAAQRIAGFLDGKHLELLTHDDFAEFLTSQYQEVTLTPQASNYEYVWDPVNEKWLRVCHATADIEMRNAVGEDPIVLSLDESATYM